MQYSIKNAVWFKKRKPFHSFKHIHLKKKALLTLSVLEEYKKCESSIEVSIQI